MGPEFQKLLIETMKGLRDAADMRIYTSHYVQKVALDLLAYIYAAVPDGKLPDPGDNLPTIFEGE